MSDDSHFLFLSVLFLFVGAEKITDNKGFLFSFPDTE